MQQNQLQHFIGVDRDIDGQIEMYAPSLFLKTLCFITSVRLKPSTIQTILPFNRTAMLHCERSMTKKG